MRFNGTFYRECNVRLALAAGADLLWSVVGAASPGLEVFQEVFHVIPNVFTMAESDLILVLLSLIDMALVGACW